NSLGGLLGAAEADETKALALASFIPHDLGGSDGAKAFKLGPQLVVVNLVVEILNVKVDSLVAGSLLDASSLVLLAQFLLTLVLLLSATNIEPLALIVLVVKLLDGFGSSFVGDKVDETESARVAILILGKRSRS